MIDVDTDLVKRIQSFVVAQVPLSMHSWRNNNTASKTARFSTKTTAHDIEF